MYNDNKDKCLNLKQTFYYFCIKKEFINLIDILEKKNERTLIINTPKATKEIMEKYPYYKAVRVFNSMPIFIKKTNKNHQIL